MGDLFKVLLESFEQFTRRKLVGIVVVGLLAVAGWTGYATFTGTYFFGRMDRKIRLLKELQGLNKDGIAQDKELGPIYLDAAEELARYQAPTIPSVGWTLGIDELWKFVTGGILFFIIALTVFSDRKAGWKSSGLAALLVGIVFGVFGVLIPTWGSPWFNYLGFPVFQILGFVMLGRLIRRGGNQQRVSGS